MDKAFGTMLADESEAKPPLIVLMGHASARTISSRSCALGLLAALGSGLRGRTPKAARQARLANEAPDLTIVVMGA